MQVLSLITLALAAAVLQVTVAKIYDKCTLARELVQKHGIKRNDVATWVCIAYRESRYNTAARNYENWDGSNDHGLFQINDRYWCSPPGPHNECNINCNLLRDDDITDDVKCIKKIYSVHGFSAWVAYTTYCANEDINSYIDGCNI